MSIILGNSGALEIGRRYEPGFRVAFQSAPQFLDVPNRRLLIQTKDLITGDRVGVSSGGISPITSPSAYVNVDLLGNVRFFPDYPSAYANRIEEALPISPSTNGVVQLIPLDSDYRWVAEIKNFSLNTERQNLDVTALGKRFGESISGLISGSGTLDCNFDYLDGCEEAGVEPVLYLHMLLLRWQEGAIFAGKFFVMNDPSLGSIWYVTDCLITRSSVKVNNEIIGSSVDFVMTGEISLELDFP